VAPHDQQRAHIISYAAAAGLPPIKLARYEDLPTAKYADCVAFIKQVYTSITGADLDLPEQQTLDLE
jgi:hypothetical protein